MKNEILEIGKVVNTHGIRGELKIQPWCDDPMIFDELEYIYIGGKKYNITKSRFHKTCEIVAVEGIDNINDAEMLKNKIVTVEREMLGELPEGTYYIADIIGLEVRADDGEVLGRVSQVISTGSNDVYEVEREGKKPLLLPVIDDVVKEVDTDGGVIVVTLIPGLDND